MTDTEALNARIDDLVTRIDSLIIEVKVQAKLRRRYTTLLSVVVLALSLVFVGFGYHQSRVDSKQSCLSQNVTRRVVRGLLQATLDATNASRPPAGLTGAALLSYNEQVAQSKVFFADQIAKVTPLVC